MAATSRQKKLMSKISENLGKPLGEAMREVGYSEEYANNPQQLTRTTGWKELTEQLLPDESLLQRLKQVINNKNDNIAIKGLDTAFKVKGRYAPEKHIIEDPYADMSDDEIFQKIEELKQMKARMNGEEISGQRPV